MSNEQQHIVQNSKYEQNKETKTSEQGRKVKTGYVSSFQELSKDV